MIYDNFYDTKVINRFVRHYNNFPFLSFIHSFIHETYEWKFIFNKKCFKHIFVIYIELKNRKSCKFCYTTFNYFSAVETTDYRKELIFNYFFLKKYYLKRNQSDRRL